MMGYIRHNSIVVTSSKADAIDDAAEYARSLGLAVLCQIEEAINGYRSVLVCPDGSKEGWQESAEGDKRRDMFRAWLDEQRYEDGSSALEWFEAAYGNDDHGIKIEAHTWEDRGRLPDEVSGD